jgi:hypothetical protein
LATWDFKAAAAASGTPREQERVEEEEEEEEEEAGDTAMPGEGSARMTTVETAIAEQRTNYQNPKNRRKNKKKVTDNYRAMIICKKGIKEEENAMEMETKTGRPASNARDRACSWCRTELLLLLFFFFFDAVTWALGFALQQHITSDDDKTLKLKFDFMEIKSHSQAT